MVTVNKMRGGCVREKRNMGDYKTTGNDVNVVDPRWVYNTNWLPNNKEVKSRLVARGFTQKYEVDYFETYAPVVKNSSVRVLKAECEQVEP